ncbi:ABC transporter substrate-binding protein [Desulfovibrio inopinatus]|uniref:ABC transporter substrate-binding protein n=1 Tax=Desulfovibrio inopinatus TaxID=102109 RepID=UPI0003FE8243|nr:ABC transporter substrate-binding protein [Desulfovibrio inopinatus]
MNFRACFVLLAALVCLASPALAKTPVIGVNQFVEHPALDAILKGFQDDLKENGVVVEYKVYNAQGNVSTTNQIANQITDDDPVLVLAIATPSAQAQVAATRKNAHMAEVPIIFSGITDPIGAGLVTNLEQPTANVTGVSNQMPMDKHVAMIKRFMPDMKALGVLYNAGEANSVSNVRRLKAAAEAQGIELIEATVANSSEVTQAAKSLVGKVQAMYVPTDNTVVSNIETVVKVAEESKTPFFCADTDSVRRGAIAAVGLDYYEHGKQTGEMARRILAGAKPQDTPVEFQKTLQFYFNPKAAQRMGLQVPQEIVESADVIIGE